MWWEGLSGSNRTYFRETLKLNVTKDTLLCELRTGSPNHLSMFFLINGLTVVVMTFIGGLVWLQQRKKK